MAECGNKDLMDQLLGLASLTSELFLDRKCSVLSSRTFLAPIDIGRNCFLCLGLARVDCLYIYFHTAYTEYVHNQYCTGILRFVQCQQLKHPAICKQTKPISHVVHLHYSLLKLTH